jgi:hypothetical protein
MHSEVFERTLKDIIGKKVSISGVSNKHMERYVCFLLSKEMRENREEVKAKLAFCKLLNLYQFPTTIKRIKIKKCKGSRFRTTMIDDANESITLLIKRIGPWAFECEGVLSKTKYFTTIADFKKYREIKIDQIERKIIRKLADKRTKNARRNNINDQLRATGDLNDKWQEYGEMDSFGAELAFCKMANCYHYFLDFKTPSKENGTDDGDVVLPDGVIIDVKQTVYNTGKLVIEVRQAPQYEKCKITGFALIVGSFSEHDGEFSFQRIYVQRRFDSGFSQGISKSYL